jgi:hypothetical protein
LEQSQDGQRPGEPLEGQPRIIEDLPIRLSDPPFFFREFLGGKDCLRIGEHQPESSERMKKKLQGKVIYFLQQELGWK